MDKQAPSIHEGEKQSCDFGIKEFNLSKRAPENTMISRGNPPKKPPGSGGTTPSSNPGVILLDFNGHLVSGTPWNTNGDINCAPANVTEAEAAIIIQRVTSDYYPFNITVTTDE